MNKSIKILSLLFVIISCSNGHKANQNPTTSDVNIDEGTTQVLLAPIEDPKSNFFSYRDTTLKKGYKYQMDFLRWEREESQLNEYRNIERKGDSLIFTTTKSKVYLINIEYDEDKQNFEAPSYSLVELNKKANVAIVQVSAYEYWYHVLVDMNSGDTINIYGKPLFNNDNTLIFASNVDLETQFTENGFQLIQKNANGFQLYHTELLDNWGIARATWFGENELLIDKATIDENYDLHFNPGVLRLNLKGM